MALGLPLGIYYYDGIFLWSFDPRLFVTFRNSNKFEVNVIPKTHVFIADGVSFIPGVSIGLGLSDNLDSWAVRPEVGVDGNVYFGVGLNFNFKNKQRK